LKPVLFWSLCLGFSTVQSRCIFCSPAFSAPIPFASKSRSVLTLLILCCRRKWQGTGCGFMRAVTRTSVFVHGARELCSFSALVVTLHHYNGQSKRMKFVFAVIALRTGHCFIFLRHSVIRKVQLLHPFLCCNVTSTSPFPLLLLIPHASCFRHAMFIIMYTKQNKIPFTYFFSDITITVNSAGRLSGEAYLTPPLSLRPSNASCYCDCDHVADSAVSSRGKTASLPCKGTSRGDACDVTCDV
jgi:hypothetical protein